MNVGSIQSLIGLLKMKNLINKITSKQLFISLLGFLLVACGGFNDSQSSATHTTVGKVIINSSFDSNNLPTKSTDSVDFASLPTVAIRSVSDKDYEPSSFASYASSALLSTNTAAHFADGFIIQYKNQNTTRIASDNISSSINTNSSARNFSNTLSFTASQIANKHRIQLNFQSETHDFAKVFQSNKKIALAQAQKIADEIAASDPNIEYVAPNTRMYPSMVPNDTYYADHMWALQDIEPFGIQAETAWNRASGNGVVVAVLDTGYRPHVDMSGRILSNGYDFISNTYIGNDSNGRDNDPIDPGDNHGEDECYTGDLGGSNSWHGTHVNGTIAANTNNSLGVAGIAYNAKILPVRVLGRCGGLTSDIADAIVWASGGTVTGVPKNTTPAKVLNLSLGGGAAYGVCNPAYIAAITKARANGAIVVVAAGNENQDANNVTPANCANAITVGATNSDGIRASFSNFGTKLDISAPGVSIASTDNDGETTVGNDNFYSYKSGTSMATPHVAAVVALILGNNLTLSVANAEKLLLQSYGPFASSGCIAVGGCGIGILNAATATKIYRPLKDFDSNGKSDILFKKLTTTANDYYIDVINGKTHKLSKIYSTATVNHQVIAVGNFNSDNKADLLEVDGNHLITKFIYMNGLLTPSTATVTGTQPENTLVLGAADFNNDGLDDLLLRSTVSGDIYISLLSVGQTELSYTLVKPVANTLVFKGLTDLNSDNYADIVWQDTETEQIIIDFMSGETVLSTNTIYAPGFEVAGVGHFLSDSDYRLLIRGSLGEVYIGKIDAGDALLTPYGSLTNSNDIADIADYNGNGYDDILWRTIGSKTNGIWSLVSNVISKISMASLDPSYIDVAQP